MKSKIIRLCILSVVSVFILVSNAPADQANGEQLYTANCAKCHGREGEGFLKLYPPIQNSSYLKEDVAQFPCIIRYGLKGKIIVEGVEFNQIMPALQTISPTQMSQIITFMQEKWEHPLTELTVSKWLEECSY